MPAKYTTVCRAKLNLYLAVTGRRADGYHDLLSLAIQLDYGDDLEAEISTTGGDTLACDNPTLSCDADNLILKATATYRKRVPDTPFLSWKLTKRIPTGAGLGGGSSDGAAALRLMNGICGNALDETSLLETAAGIGSDCPLFLFDGPVVMRGRGERIERASNGVSESLRGKKVVVIKPTFGVPTAWAYGALDKAGAMTDPETAESELGAWLANPNENPPHRNSFENVVFRKHLCYDALNESLAKNGLPTLRLTGSGSACYAFADGDETNKIIARSRESLGESCFAIRAKLC